MTNKKINVWCVYGMVDDKIYDSEHYVLKEDRRNEQDMITGLKQLAKARIDQHHWKKTKFVLNKFYWYLDAYFVTKTGEHNSLRVSYTTDTDKRYAKVLKRKCEK